MITTKKKYKTRNQYSLVLTHRKCKECGELLYSNRWRVCEECQPELPSIDDDAVYNDFSFSDEEEE